MKKTILFGLITAIVILSGCNKDKAKEPAEAVTGTIIIEDETKDKELIIKPSEEIAGNGEYEFVSYSENVKGIIKMNGWEGASFEVTESVDSPFTVGENFEFDFAF